MLYSGGIGMYLKQGNCILSPSITQQPEVKFSTSLAVSEREVWNTTRPDSNAERFESTAVSRTNRRMVLGDN